MRIDNINFHPIRLEAKRIANKTYEISRNGEPRGTIKSLEDGWKIAVHDRKVYPSMHRASSFKAAVLKLCRMHMTASSDGVQDYGDRRTIRINVSSVWYMVTFHKNGNWVFQDTMSHTDVLSDIEQARLRVVVSEAEKFRKANL